MVRNMKKVYRISAYNRTTRMRELLFEEYTSRKKAQEMADRMNELDKDGIIKAFVVVKLK